MKIFNLLILASAIWLWSAQGIAGEKIVSMAVLEWEPYAGKKLEKLGVGSEILTAAFNRAGYDVKFYFMPWVRALKDTETGKYDAVCYGYYSDQRAKTYALSNPFMESALVFCKHRDSDISYQSIQDLKPYRIGVVRGFVNTIQFDAADYLTKEEANNEILNLKKLLNRRVDLVLIDKFVGQHLINTLFFADKDDFEFISPPFKIHPMYVMFSRKVKDYEQKLKVFNNGLQLITRDGTISKIMEYHGFR